MFGVFLNPDLCHLCHLCHLCLGTSCQGISSVLAYTKPLKSMQVGTCFTESNPKGPARRTRFTCLHLSPSIQSKCQDLWISNLGTLWLRSVSFVFFPRPLCPSDFVRRSCNGLWCSKRFARCSVRCGDLPFFPIRLLSFAVFFMFDKHSHWSFMNCIFMSKLSYEIIVYFWKTAAFPNKASNWSILIILADLEHLGGPVISDLTAARSKPKVAQQRPFGISEWVETCWDLFPASQCGHLAHHWTFSHPPY